MIRFRRMTSFVRHSALGEPFTFYRKEPLVQRIDDKFLDCSVYLYPTEDHAAKGLNVGASGFLVALPSAGHGWLLDGICPSPDYRHLYVVSNRHNIIKTGRGRPKPVVRLNTHDGNTSVIPAQVSDWFCSGEHDLAVLPIPFRKYHRYVTLPYESFLTKAAAARHDVGIGDEVFMIGRFVNNEGRQQNLPSARFGHVSMMPSESEPLSHKNSPSGSQVSFLVEVHSIPGYSGSPVIVRPSPVPVPKLTAPLDTTNTAGVVLSMPDVNYERPVTLLQKGPWLLGVEWGVICNEEENVPRYYTGMSGVVPAWYLSDLLNSPDVVMQRRREQEVERERVRHIGTTETAGPDLSS